MARAPLKITPPKTEKDIGQAIYDAWIRSIQAGTPGVITGPNKTRLENEITNALDLTNLPVPTFIYDTANTLNFVIPFAPFTNPAGDMQYNNNSWKRSMGGAVIYGCGK